MTDVEWKTVPGCKNLFQNVTGVLYFCSYMGIME